MVQARPIPGYLPVEEENSSLPNGSHEEINLEARRKHRLEKLPPLSGSTDNQDQDQGLEDQETANDAEKILTIEQAKDTEEELLEQKPTRGQKISNFFKSLGKKKDEQENEEDGNLLSTK